MELIRRFAVCQSHFPLTFKDFVFLARMFGATEFVNPKDYDKPIQQVRPLLMVSMLSL